LPKQAQGYVNAAPPFLTWTLRPLIELQVLAWLRVKVAKTSEGLCQCSSSFADMDPKARTAYAASLLGEYLTASWRTLLNDSLGIQIDGEVPILLWFESLEPANGLEVQVHHLVRRGGWNYVIVFIYLLG
jgi:hypothetical protein